MKKRIVVLVLVAVFVVGCSGVQLSPKYSDLLNRTAAVSAEIAKRAEVGELSEDEMKAALVKQAETWKLFQDAKNGVNK